MGTFGGNVIDFDNASFAKLKPVQDPEFEALVQSILITGEAIVGTYKGIRDGVIFTNKRLIAINVQGLTGKKKDFTSLPYSKVQAFSVETAGVFDLDSELDLWFSGLGKVRFEFVANADVSAICRMVGEYIIGAPGSMPSTPQADRAESATQMPEHLPPPASPPPPRPGL